MASAVAASAAAVDAAQPLASQYPLGPTLGNRFRPTKAREIVGSVLKSKLSGAAYHADKSSALTREIADDIKQRLKAEGWLRYKFVVQVFIGEQRGEGCRMSSRCFWDSETDQYAFESFKNDTIFSVAAVFAAYVY